MLSFTYEGDIVDGKAHGNGVCKYENGDTYDGEWQAGKKHGHGVLAWADGHTICDPNGQRCHDWPNGGKYIGGFHAGRQHGIGVFVDPYGKRQAPSRFRHGLLIRPGTAGTCWEAHTPDFPSCSGYAFYGYTCVGDYCATMSPGGDPASCASRRPSSRVDPTTGKCIADNS